MQKKISSFSFIGAFLIAALAVGWFLAGCEMFSYLTVLLVYLFLKKIISNVRTSNTN